MVFDSIHHRDFPSLPGPQILSPRHGSNVQIANRFIPLHVVACDDDGVAIDPQTSAKIQYMDDDSQSIVSSNNSPDLPFDYSLNPYRGCVHGCAYCYARPTHEYLGFSAGLDFETRIIVKRNAAELFQKFLSKPNWDASPITFSGVTDCYQPVERKLELTRQCVSVAEAFGQPISIVTKNALVERDVELLSAMAERNLVRVYISITTLGDSLAADMEPRTSRPAARLRAVETLSAAGVPVGVLMAPLIPGLNETEMAAVIAAAADAGARLVRYNVLRLPDTVLPVFEQWLRRVRPGEAEKVLGRIRDLRGGALNDSRFGSRMRGSGPAAKLLSQCFKMFANKHGMDGEMPPQSRDHFRVPAVPGGQRQGNLPGFD